MKKLTVDHVVRVQCVCILVLILLVSTVYWVFFQNVPSQIELTKPIHGWHSVRRILMNNTLVMLVNYIGFIISPILALVNWGTQIFEISYGISQFGVMTSISRLFPHCLIEIPTIILFQLLSLQMLKIFIDSQSLRQVVNFMMVNKTWYGLTIIGTILGAVVEGR